MLEDFRQCCRFRQLLPLQRSLLAQYLMNQQVLFAIGAAKLLFAAMHPASNYFGSLIALHEHSSMQAIVAAGGQLAPNQMTRLLEADAIASLQAMISSQAVLSWGLLIATVAGFVMVAKPTQQRAFIMVAVIVGAAVGLLLQGLPGFPVLVLGLVAVLGSLMTDDLFQRAKVAH